MLFSILQLSRHLRDVPTLDLWSQRETLRHSHLEPMRSLLVQTQSQAPDARCTSTTPHQLLILWLIDVARSMKDFSALTPLLLPRLVLTPGLRGPQLTKPIMTEFLV